MKIWIALFSAAALMAQAAIVRAEIVTHSLIGTVGSGPFAGTVGTGSFSYDSALLTGVGHEGLDPQDGLTLEFTIFGQTFLHSDDIDFDGYPTLEFQDGVPTTFDFVVQEPIWNPVNPTDIDEPGVFGFDFGDLTFDSSEDAFRTDVFIDNVGPVPVPSTLVGFIGAGGVMLVGAALRRRG